jgi:hypothetical protein
VAGGGAYIAYVAVERHTATRCAVYRAAPGGSLEGDERIPLPVTSVVDD